MERALNYGTDLSEEEKKKVIYKQIAMDEEPILVSY